MNDLDRVVYSLCVEDIQNVAEGSFGRKLTDAEVEIVEEQLGDYIKWYDLIEAAILGSLAQRRARSEE
jgi:hypothetical protein